MTQSRPRLPTTPLRRGSTVNTNRSSAAVEPHGAKSSMLYSDIQRYTNALKSAKISRPGGLQRNTNDEYRGIRGVCFNRFDFRPPLMTNKGY